MSKEFITIKIEVVKISKDLFRASINNCWIVAFGATDDSAKKKAKKQFEDELYAGW